MAVITQNERFQNWPLCSSLNPLRKIFLFLLTEILSLTSHTPHFRTYAKSIFTVTPTTFLRHFNIKKINFKLYKKTRNTSAMRCWNFYLKQYCRLVLNSFAYKVHDNVVACLIRASIMQVMQISRFSLRKKKPLNTTDEKYTLLQIKSTNSQQLIHDVYSKGWLYYQRWGKRSVT